MSDVGIEDDEELRRLLPTSFGKQDRIANTAAQVAQSKRPTSTENWSKCHTTRREEPPHSDASDNDTDSSDEEDSFPTSHELLIKTHERAVTTIALDTSGVRLITGSSDCTLKFHDFSSMTPTTIRAFKTVDPTASKNSGNNDTHPIHKVQFNPLSPSRVLAVTALPQAKILSRDGDVLATFVKGDMYLRDMHKTKGHVSEVTSGTWHSTIKDLCVTAGTDSSLRIWDMHTPQMQKDVIVYKSRAPGSAGRTRMTAVVWGSQAQGGSDVLVATAFDGSLVMWSGGGPYNRPIAEIEQAHIRTTWTGGLDISADGRLVVTRGADETIKVWDTRKFQKPVNVVNHPSTYEEFPTSSIRFSPDSANIVTGDPAGRLHILNPATLKAEAVTQVTPGSPLISVDWHEKLNQIITGSANAETHVLYNPNISNGGAKAVMTRTPKHRHIDDDPNRTLDLSQGLSGDAFVANASGIVTNSGQGGNKFSTRHPNVGMTVSGRSRDPRRPHVPASTPFANSQPSEEHVRNQVPFSSMREEDPREALLKYSEKAEKDPMFTKAWKQTQPKTIYGEISDEEDEPAKKKAKVGNDVVADTN